MDSSTTTTTTERAKVGMLVPPPLLLAVLALAAAGLQTVLLGWPGWGSPWRVGLAVLGAALVLASLSLLAACSRRFREAGTPVRPTSPVTAIVASGPYAFSRNPMYVAMIGLLVGGGLATGSVFLGGAALVFLLVVHHGVVLPEERYLRSELGPDYEAYQRKVRRWL